MDERAVQFRVGTVVLATLIIAAILIILFSDARSLIKGQYTVKAVFVRAPGIAPDSPVRMSGKRVGKVQGVEFDEQRRVVVSMEIDEDVPLYLGDVCQVSGSLLGDSVVEFVPTAKPMAGRQRLEDGAVVDGVASPSPQEILVGLQDNLVETIDSLGRAGNEVAGLARNVQDFLGTDDKRIARIMQKTETALDNFNQTMGSLDTILGDQEMQTNLRQALEDMPKLLAETRQTVKNFDNVATLADENLTNLKGFTGPLGERGDVLAERLESSITQLDEVLEQAVVFTRAMNSGEGSLGQLMNNPDLYQNLNRAAMNIEAASKQIEPILHDVRVFTDKIARDPGRLGASGVIRRSAPIK